MPYEFQGENLVYVAPPEMPGYTWKSVGGGGGSDASPGNEQWVQNPDFDPNSLLTGRVDKYGRIDYSPRADLSEAEKRAYNLAWGGYSPSSMNVTESGANVGTQHENLRSSGWWDVDPAIQNAVEAANNAHSGNAVGMSSWKDYITPALILAGGAGAAIGGGALAGEAALGAGEVGAGTGVGAGSAGLNFASPSGIMAAQSAAGLGGAGTGIIEGLIPSSVGMGGTAGAGSLAGITATEAAAGLGGAALGTGLTAEQLAAYEAANPGMSAKDVLTKLNQVRQVAGTANSIAKLLGGAGAGAGAAGLSGGANSLYGSNNTAATALSHPAIEDLTPQLTKSNAFKFANTPTYNAPLTNTTAPTQPDYTQQILNAAEGGLIQGFAMGDHVGKVEGVEVLSPQVIRARRQAAMFQNPQLTQSYVPHQYAQGGDVEGHNPQFFSEGGLNSLENTYVKGDGDGTSDSVPAMLANGEFVVPADVVSKLGNGSNDAGADVLSEFLATIREHAQNHDPKKLPPESKGALAYLLDAKRKIG